MLSIPCTHLVHIGKLKTAQGHWLCSETTNQTAPVGAVSASSIGIESAS